MNLKFLSITLICLSLGYGLLAKDALEVQGVVLSKQDINKQHDNVYISNEYFYKNYSALVKQVNSENGVTTEFLVKKNKKLIGTIRSNKLALDSYGGKLYAMSDAIYLLFEQESEFGMSFILIEVTNGNAKKITENYYECDKYMPPKLKGTTDCYPANFTIFDNNNTLYLKVGSTYKSDIITLKKPTSVK